MKEYITLNLLIWSFSVCIYEMSANLCSDGRNPEVLRSGMVYNHTLSAPFCQAMLIFSNSWGTHLFLSMQLGTLYHHNYHISSYHSWWKVYNWALLKKTNFS